MLKENEGELILPSHPQRTDFIVCVCVCVCEREREEGLQTKASQTGRQSGSVWSSQERNALMERRAVWFNSLFSLLLFFSTSFWNIFYPEKRVKTLREGFDSADRTWELCCLCEIERRNISSWPSTSCVTCTLWWGRSDLTCFLFFILNVTYRKYKMVPVWSPWQPWPFSLFRSKLFLRRSLHQSA